MRDIDDEISNERLEELANGDMEVWYSESQSMARELLALRKERERAEPVYQVQAMDWHDVEKYLYDEALDRGIRCRVLYTAPPAPVVPKIDRKAICNKVHWLCARSPGATFYNAAEYALDEVIELLAPPAPVVPEVIDRSQATYDMTDHDESFRWDAAAGYIHGWNACRAEMLNQK